MSLSSDGTKLDILKNQIIFCRGKGKWKLQNSSNQHEIFCQDDKEVEFPFPLAHLEQPSEHYKLFFSLEIEYVFTYLDDLLHVFCYIWDFENVFFPYFKQFHIWIFQFIDCFHRVQKPVKTFSTFSYNIVDCSIHLLRLPIVRRGTQSLSLM